MNYGKALEEVWAARETLEKELEGKTPEQQIKYINDKADEACKKYGVRVKQQPAKLVHV